MLHWKLFLIWHTPSNFTFHLVKRINFGSYENDNGSRCPGVRYHSWGLKEWDKVTVYEELNSQFTNRHYLIEEGEVMEECEDVCQCENDRSWCKWCNLQIFLIVCKDRVMLYSCILHVDICWWDIFGYAKVTLHVFYF